MLTSGGILYNKSQGGFTVLLSGTAGTPQMSHCRLIHRETCYHNGKNDYYYSTSLGTAALRLHDDNVLMDI